MKIKIMEKIYTWKKERQNGSRSLLQVKRDPSSVLQVTGDHDVVEAFTVSYKVMRKEGKKSRKKIRPNRRKNR